MTYNFTDFSMTVSILVYALTINAISGF